MAQATDITVADGSATPVNISFKVLKASPDLTIFKDRRQSPVVKQPEITLSADIPAANQKVRKCEMRVAVPVVDAVSGTVTDVARSRVIFDLPQNAPQTVLNDLYAYTANSLSNALIKGAVRDSDTIIG